MQVRAAEATMGNKKAWEWDSAANLVTGITPSCPHAGCESETMLMTIGCSLFSKCNKEHYCLAALPDAPTRAQLQKRVRAKDRAKGIATDGLPPPPPPPTEPPPVDEHGNLLMPPPPPPIDPPPPIKPPKGQRSTSTSGGVREGEWQNRGGRQRQAPRPTSSATELGAPGVAAELEEEEPEEPQERRGKTGGTNGRRGAEEEAKAQAEAEAEAEADAEEDDDAEADAEVGVGGNAYVWGSGGSAVGEDGRSHPIQEHIRPNVPVGADVATIHRLMRLGLAEVPPLPRSKLGVAMESGEVSTTVDYMRVTWEVGRIASGGFKRRREGSSRWNYLCEHGIKRAWYVHVYVSCRVRG